MDELLRNVAIIFITTLRLFDRRLHIASSIANTNVGLRLSSCIQYCWRKIHKWCCKWDGHRRLRRLLRLTILLFVRCYWSLISYWSSSLVECRTHNCRHHHHSMLPRMNSSQSSAVSSQGWDQDYKLRSDALTLWHKLFGHDYLSLLAQKEPWHLDKGQSSRETFWSLCQCFGALIEGLQHNTLLFRKFPPSSHSAWIGLRLVEALGYHLWQRFVHLFYMKIGS